MGQERHGHQDRCDPEEKHPTEQTYVYLPKGSQTC